MIFQDELQRVFLLESMNHGKAMSIGNHREANQAHARLHTLYKEIKKNNEQEIFYGLLDHGDENVRLWAAIFTLPNKPQEAEKILKELAHSGEKVRVDAELALRLWNEGKLDLL